MALDFQSHDLAQDDQTLRSTQPRLVVAGLVEADFYAFLQTMAQPVAAVDPQGHITFVNDCLLEITGQTREQVLNHDWLEVFVPAAERSARRERFLTLASSGLKHSRMRATLLSQTGAVREIIWNLVLLSDNQGRPCGFACVGEDLTDRHKNEAALMRSREYYLTLFDAFPTLVWRCGTDGQSNYFNRAWLNFTGRTLSQELGAGWNKSVHPDDFGRCDAIVMAAFAERAPFTMEVRLRHRDGAYRWIEVNGQAFDDLDGSFGGYLGSCHDIHDKKLAELAREAALAQATTLNEQLRDSTFVFLAEADEAERKAAELEAILDALGDGLLILDVNGRVVRSNERLRALLSFDPAGLDAFTELYEGHQATTGINVTFETDTLPAQRALAGEVVRDSVCTVRCADGSYIWYSFNASPIKDPEGQIVGAVCTVTDVTERHRAQATIRESESRLRRLTDNMQGLIVQVGMNGQFEYVSPSHEALLGISTESLMNSTIDDLFHPDDVSVVLAAVHHAVQERVANPWEFRCRRADNSYIWIEAVAKVVCDGDDRPVSVVLSGLEITARKKAQQQVSESIRRLREVLDGTVNALATTAEMRDPYTAGHQRKVTELTVAIARRMGFSEEDLEGMRIAATLHDIGKLRIPSEILIKPGALSRHELALMRTHAQMSHEILKTIAFPWPVAETVLQHHERLNGTGYPAGLRGSEIVLGARIIAVADVVEAMSHHRPYRPAIGISAALNEVESRKGLLYDPDVVDVCLALFREDGFGFTE